MIQAHEELHRRGYPPRALDRHVAAESDRRPGQGEAGDSPRAVSVLIPAYNEEAAIADVIRDIRKVMTDAAIEVYEIIVIDDGSKDQTAATSARAGARVLRHPKNRGYGASLKTGIRAAAYELIVITDADGTYPPQAIPDLIARLRNADMVVGARVGQNVAIPLTRRPAKWILQRLAEYITTDRIPDLNSGMRAFRRECVWQYLPIVSEKFSFTTTLTVAMLSDSLHVQYVPIDYLRRIGKSKITPWDFVNFVALVLRLSMLFKPLRVFVPVSFSLLGFALLKLVLDVTFAVQRLGTLSWELLRTQTVSTTTLVLFVSGLQILLAGMVSDGLIRKISQRIPSGYRTQSGDVWDDVEQDGREIALSSPPTS